MARRDVIAAWLDARLSQAEEGVLPRGSTRLGTVNERAESTMGAGGGYRTPEWGAFRTHFSPCLPCLAEDTKSNSS